MKLRTFTRNSQDAPWIGHLRFKETDYALNSAKIYSALVGDPERLDLSSSTGLVAGRGRSTVDEALSIQQLAISLIYCCYMYFADG